MSGTPRESDAERKRLDALRSLELLDIEHDERFDVFARILSNALNTPIAFVGFMDSDRLVLTACQGLEDREFPREETFCDHAMEQDFLVIPDATAHPVFANKPAVMGKERIRFYAGSVIKGHDGTPLGTLCALDRKPRSLSDTEKQLMQDLTRLLESELAVQHKMVTSKQQLLANTFHDPVTGLAREALGRTTLEALIRDAIESRTYLAVAALHFPRYDELVGTYGQDEADKVAQEIARRAKSVTRADGLVARPESDRFLLAQPGLRTPEEGVDWAYMAHQAIREPLHVGDGRRDVKASMGIAIAPTDGQNSETLLRCARLAMRLRSGPGVQCYAAQSDDHIRRRDLVSRHLADALKHDLLDLHYQPIYDAQSGRVVTCEALARWHDEQLGFISPGEFIPLAERDNTLSRVLTCWVLRRALGDATDWNAGLDRPVKVNVNIAGPEFYEKDFVEVVEEAIEASDFDRNLLVLEITEQTIISDFDQAIKTIQRLRDSGINVVLDDFGTGYSSLNYLRHLPLDGLKIDRSFVDDLPDDRAACDVAGAIASIGKALNMHIVAEGVETERQKQLLCELTCDRLQGFLFSKGVPRNELDPLLLSTW